MMIKNKANILLMLILTVCVFMFDTTVEADNTPETQDNYFEVNYNNFSGLPTSESNDIIQTSDGYIWIASYSSLIRYDGKEFVTFMDEGLTSILCLYVDSKDRLWIGTNNDGVILYEDNEFKFVTSGQNVPSFSARSITEISTGEILVGTALGMFVIDNDMNFYLQEDSRLENAFVNKLINFDENYTFGLTKTGDLFILEGTEIIHFIAMEEWEYDLPQAVITYNSENTNDKCFLIGTNSDYLVKLTIDKDQKINYEKISIAPLRVVNALYEDSYGRVWIGCDYGIGYMDKQENVYSLDSISMNKSIEGIMEDLEGNFWLVSSKEGVAKLNPTIFKNVSSAIEVPTQMNGVEILDGYMYVASSNGIDIIKQSDGSLVQNELTEKYRGGYFRCVQQDDLGNLWFSSYTEDGLVKYTPETGEIKNFNEEQGLNYSRIRSTMTASDGKIWVATGNGIYIIENDEVITYYGSETGMLNLEILTLSEDKEGRIFAGTDGAGVYIFENGEIVRKLSREEGLLSDIILRTETDPINDGTWIITGNSIAFYDFENDTIQTINKFPYGNNYDLMFYEDTMVILCSNGIFFAQHDDMLNFDNTPLQYMHKNHLNGLYSAAVANSFSKIQDGILYLCGYQNITTYDLNVTALESDYIPPISLPQVFVNEEIVNETGDNYYHLPSTANFLMFDIFIPTYALEDYSVSYILEGYEQLVHTSNYNSYVDPTYTNLPGGEYDLYVTLSDQRTGALINANRFKIVKEYAFLEDPITQTTIIMLTIIAIFLLIYAVVKNKLKKNQQKKEEIEALFQDTLEVLSKVIDAKDRYTNGHSKRVAFYTKEIAVALGFNKDDVDSAYGIALLHDIGKIGIPDEVLNKPGRLDFDEFEVMKTHASGGGDILERIRAWPDLVVGAKYHHERYDGSGYADGLKGEEIPRIARIICVADAFDAMYSTRVYRKKMDLDIILNELESNSGTQFDPEICKIFIDLVKSGKINGVLKTYTKEDDEKDQKIQGKTTSSKTK